MARAVKSGPLNCGAQLIMREFNAYIKDSSRDASLVAATIQVPSTPRAAPVSLLLLFARRPAAERWWAPGWPLRFAALAQGLASGILLRGSWRQFRGSWRQIPAWARRRRRYPYMLCTCSRCCCCCRALWWGGWMDGCGVGCGRGGRQAIGRCAGRLPSLTDSCLRGLMALITANRNEVRRPASGRRGVGGCGSSLIYDLQ
jgi:hypothetical protein